MTFEEIKDAFKQGDVCEFYSSGKGWVAWLDEGWHAGSIVAWDEVFPCVTLQVIGVYSICTILVEVRGEEDITNLLQCEGWAP